LAAYKLQTFKGLDLKFPILPKEERDKLEEARALLEE